MIIRLITVGCKMPSWINDGYLEFAKRLPADYTLQLVEIPPEKRSKNADIARIIEIESEKISAALNPRHLNVALDVKGKAWSTPELANFLEQQHDQSRNIDLMIGGPDGLSQKLLQNAAVKWSLSPLTFPHPLVRLIVAEQLYRAWTIIKKHPYHRD